MAHHQRGLRRIATLSLISLGLAALLFPEGNLRGQTPARRSPTRPSGLAKPTTAGAEQPKFKGIFEPVNYNQDLKLNDVFFVTGDEGWVSGDHGTILHTRDAGKSWQPQLGGDPQSQEQPIDHLRFLDARHGWALQPAGPRKKLLRTSDGENWEQAGMLPENVIDYQFVSPTVGILLEGNNNYSIIHRSVDGGRTWKEAFPQSACTFNAEVQGLSRRVTCAVSTLSVASRMVAYAVGRAYEVPDMIVVAKTQDGGITWSLSSVHGPSEVFDFYGQQWQRLLFLDEQNGLFATDGERLYATSDGGASWRGVAGAAGPRIGFADPEVGWAFKHLNFGFDYVLRYTSDGGKRWLSRSLHFPAEVVAFSLPLRSTGYVVGNHGMVYRYRIVPTDYKVANMVEAPLMEGFNSPVFGEVATLNDVVTKMRQKLPIPAGGFPQDTTAIAGSGNVGGAPSGVRASGFQQDTGTGPVAGGYMDSCCGALMQQLETTSNSFAMNVPTYSQHFRNLNLILEGLTLVNSIVGQANTLKQSVRALRQAPNQQAAAAALTNVQAQLNGISSSGGFVQDVSTPLQ